MIHSSSADRVYALAPAEFGAEGGKATMSLRLTLLGTGTPTPSLERGGCSFLVEHNDAKILFDSGPATVRRLLSAGVPPTQITHVFLTHLHYDHCMDYGYLTLTRWDQGAGQIPELQIYGPAGTARMTHLLFSEEGVFQADLAGRTLHPGSHLIYEHRGGRLPRQRPGPIVREVSAGTVVEGESWQVEVAEMVHCQPYLQSVAYRFNGQEGSIVVTGDTAPNPQLVELARGADVLLHMCHFLNDVETDPRLTSSCSGHLDAARTAAEAGVEKLVLIHLTEQITRPGIRERMVAEASATFNGTVILGEDLMQIPIGAIRPEPIL